MADNYDNNRRGGFGNSNDREGRGNNFDRRYSDGGYFDRSFSGRRNTRATDDRLNRALPPIEPTYQPPQAVPAPQQYVPNAMGAIPVAPMGAVQQPTGIPVAIPSDVRFFSLSALSDVQGIIDHLRRSEPAIVDFVGIDEENGQRSLDFLSGAIYALGGSMRKITGTVFLLTPAGVTITIADSDIANSVKDKRNKR